MSEKHTELPYKIGQNDAPHEIYGNGTMIARCFGSHGDIKKYRESQLANAEFIVRACNNHYELLELRKVIASMADDAERIAIPFNKPPKEPGICYEINAKDLLDRFISIAFRQRELIAKAESKQTN